MSNRGTRRVPKAAALAAPRTDGWSNVLTGLGVSGSDKRLGSNLNVNILDQESAELVWRADDIGGRIVETFPNEMLREGHCIETQHEAEDEGIGDAFEAWDRQMATVERLRFALYYRRAYGGSAILLGVDDGRDWALPLAENRIKSLKFLTVLTPRELYAYRYYADITQPKYGEVSHYQIQPIAAPVGAPVQPLRIIHESRLVRMDGIKTSRWQSLYNGVAPGWNDSVFVRCLPVVTDFQHSYQAAGILLQDFAPPVLKMKGLFQLLQSAKGDGGTQLRTRLAALEQSRSVARVNLLDSEEEYKRESTNLQGLPEMLEKFMSRLAAAVDMPVSLLMGNSPAGLNSTGDAEMRWFYDRVAAMQVRELEPALRRIYEVAMLSPDGPTKGTPLENWSIKFNPLWQLTEAEMADVRLKQAQADNLYITNGTLLGTEVARSRFGGKSYSTDTRIDLTERQKLMESEAEQQAGADVAGREADPEGPAAQAAKAATEKPAQNPKPPTGK